VEWAYLLRGRSGGIGMAGVAPVSFREIEAWARLMDIGELHPLEVEAIVVLDAAMISTNNSASEPTPEERSILGEKAWPQRKEMNK